MLPRTQKSEINLKAFRAANYTSVLGMGRAKRAKWCVHVVATGQLDLDHVHSQRCCNATVLQIRFFLLQNRQGKTRLSKWYVAIEESEKRKIENEVHRMVTSRDSKFTNFVEVRRLSVQALKRVELGSPILLRALSRMCSSVPTRLSTGDMLAYSFRSVLMLLIMN